MLSIIIPTLNEEGYLSLLLESIKKQNFNEDYEIIVADANSKDKTVEIAKSYGCKVITGGSPPKGRNEGAKAASGDLFLFLDADTILLKNFLKNLLEKFNQKKLKIATVPICLKENWFDNLVYGLYNIYVELTQFFLPHAANFILIKREIHQKIGGFDETIKIGEDHDYARRASKFGRFKLIKTEPVLISSRRFEQDGRLKTYLKYVLVGVYVIFLGPVRSDIFKYRFGHYLKKPKK